MKNLTIILCLFFISCDQCDCDYVIYENGMETYRQYWNQDCEDQTLSSETYYDFDGQLIQRIIVIDCN